MNQRPATSNRETLGFPNRGLIGAVGIVTAYSEDRYVISTSQRLRNKRAAGAEFMWPSVSLLLLECADISD